MISSDVAINILLYSTHVNYFNKMAVQRNVLHVYLVMISYIITIFFTKICVET